MHGREFQKDSSWVLWIIRSPIFLCWLEKFMPWKKRLRPLQFEVPFINKSSAQSSVKQGQIIGRIFGTPSRGYQAGKLVASSTTEKCNGSGRRDCKFPKQLYNLPSPPQLDLLGTLYNDP
mmetsp:Transcript_19356/g.31711  ORF Transcript_19356/g.31711 Transcript_19356/m.31711 type:complete len:120 (-) Transcript_19356:228-587(-)